MLWIVIYCTGIGVAGGDQCAVLLTGAPVCISGSPVAVGSYRLWKQLTCCCAVSGAGVIVVTLHSRYAVVK